MKLGKYQLCSWNYYAYVHLNVSGINDYTTNSWSCLPLVCKSRATRKKTGEGKTCYPEWEKGFRSSRKGKDFSWGLEGAPSSLLPEGLFKNVEANTIPVMRSQKMREKWTKRLNILRGALLKFSICSTEYLTIVGPLVQ